MQTEAIFTISRAKYHASGMNVEWRWLYSVTLPNGETSTRGTSLSEARVYARRMARLWGGGRIAYTWEHIGK